MRLVDWRGGVGVALGQLALYVLVTVAATLVLERPLLREVLGYVRGRPRPASAGAI